MIQQQPTADGGDEQDRDGGHGCGWAGALNTGTAKCCSDQRDDTGGENAGQCTATAEDTECGTETDGDKTDSQSRQQLLQDPVSV